MQTDFRTVLDIQEGSIKLDHNTGFLLNGSCFSENIGQKLTDSKFKICSNPFGISYNPISIHQNIALTSSEQIKFEEREGIHFSYQLHSQLNASSKEDFQINISEAIEQQKGLLEKEGVLIITYGTAWIYEEIESNQIVNNCQKQPSKLFQKRLLSVQEIVTSWQKTTEYLKNNFPSKKIIFTVSPVRHLKDGFRENQLSKSILHLAVEQICNKDSTCSYFPSYELVMDDLRDYRFFKDDFLHPNELAINYIWDKFSNNYFSKSTLLLMQQVEKFNKAIQHRAFQADSKQHQKFLLNLKSKIKAFQFANNLDFKVEIDYLKSQIL